MKIITPTGDVRQVVITDYQSDVYANGVLALANAQLNFVNTATVNVSAVANGVSQVNLGFSVNTSAVGGGGGGSGSYLNDIFANGTLVIANANLNFNNTATVNVTATANGSGQANVSFSANLTGITAAGDALSSNLVAVYLSDALVMANANINFQNTATVNVAVVANAANKRANITFTVPAGSNAGVVGVVSMNSAINNVGNTQAATTYAANVASLVPVMVENVLIGSHRNVNFRSANTSNVVLAGIANTDGNVTVTFDTRVTAAGGSDPAQGNLVAVYANNTLAMANANLNFNNSATVNVAVTANAANKRANVEFSVNDNIRVEDLVVSFDGGGLVLTTGDSNVYYTAPYAGTIDSWYITASPSGNVVIDVWKRAGVLPVNANTIAGSEKPTLASAQLANDLTLSSWTTPVARGDIFGFEIESVSLITKATLVLRILRT